MMNIAHLWWIVPLAILVGYWGCAIIRTGKDADERMDEIMREYTERKKGTFVAGEELKKGDMVVANNENNTVSKAIQRKE